MIATAAYDDLIRLWDIKTGELAVKWKAHKVRRLGIHPLAFSPDGSLLASGSDDDAVRLWDMKEILQRKQNK